MGRRDAYQIWLIGSIVPMLFIGLMVASGRTESDFSTFWVASKMVLAGNAAGAYDTVQSAAAAKALLGIESVIFPYPPQSFFVFVPFALVPHLAGFLIWNALTAVLFVVAAKPYLPKGFPLLLTVLTPAALLNLFFGQTGLLFGALWLFAFRGSWFAVALLAFKPHLGVIAALTLRDFNRFALASAALITIVLVSVLVFGVSAWVAFIDHAFVHAADIGHRKRWLFAGVSPAIPYGYLGWIPFATAAALMLARKFNAFTAATAAILISPYGFHYDLVVATLGFGLVIFSEWQELPAWRRLAITAGFLSPVISLLGAWWIPPVLLFALWAQVNEPNWSFLGRPNPTARNEN